MKLQDSEWYNCDTCLFACLEWLGQQCADTQIVLRTLSGNIQDAEIAASLQNFSELLLPIKTQVTHVQARLANRYQSYVNTVEQSDSILY